MKQYIWSVSFVMRREDGRIRLQHLLADLTVLISMLMVMKFFL